jgi:hypothetical protein
MSGFVISAGLTPTAAELAMMTPEERKQHAENAARNVFGHDVQFDKHGKPIEQGIGSAASANRNPRANENHFRAIGKYEGAEAEAIARQAAIQKGKT